MILLELNQQLLQNSSSPSRFQIIIHLIIKRGINPSANPYLMKHARRKKNHLVITSRVTTNASASLLQPPAIDDHS